MSVAAGTLRHRLRIDQRVELPTGTGGSTVTWVTLKTIWGRMMPLSGREYIQSEQTLAMVMVRALIRANSGVSPTMRVVFRGLNYNVEAVLPDRDSWNEYENLMLSEIAGVDG